MDFREVLSHCDLYDIGFTGLPWTYNNNQGGDWNVRVRLGRGVANSDWSLRWPEAVVRHLTSSQSDHKALLLDLCPTMRGPNGGSVFRCEIVWEREGMLGSVIEKALQRRNPGSDLGALAEALKIVTQDLREWSKAKFGHVTRRMEELCGVLESLERDDPIQNRASILTAKRELDEMLYTEEMMWMQCSRISWLREGDQNTNYFHQKARWRATKKHIKKLRRDDGSWTSGQKEMQEMATDYFNTLFQRDELVNPQEVVDLFNPVITEKINRGSGEAVQ